MGEGDGELVEGFVVEQGEGLERGVGALPTGAGGEGVGGIEHGEGRVEGGTLEMGVEGAPMSVSAHAGFPFAIALGEGAETGRLRRKHRRPTDARVEQSADEEGGITDLFGFEPEPGLAGEMSIAGVLFGEIGPMVRGLAIGLAGDDEPMDMAQAPAGSDEFPGEPVEQGGVGGFIAHGAEVVFGLDQSLAEVGLPDAIDGDPGGEWVGRIQHPIGEVATVPGGFGGWGEGDGRGGGDLGAGPGEVALDEHDGFAGFGEFLHDEGAPGLGSFAFPVVDLVASGLGGVGIQSGFGYQGFTPGEFLLPGVEGGLLIGRGDFEFGARGGAVSVVLGGIEEGEEGVVIALGEGIELVVVALGAGERDTEPDRGGGVDAVDDAFEAELFGVDAALMIDLGVPMESGRDTGIDRGIGEEVAGDLPAGEGVEGQVLVECADKPVSIRPDRADAIDAVAVGICIARCIQPPTGPTFAVMRGGEQSFDGLVVAPGIGIREEGVEFVGRRGEAGEVEGEAAQEDGWIGFAGGDEFLGVQSFPDEGVDGVGHACQGGRCDRGGWDEGPVLV